MFPGAKPLTDVQRQALCRMMYQAFLEVRALGSTGTAQASDLADAFHNLPIDMWSDHFSLLYFRDVFLAAYQNKYADAQKFNYIAMLDEIMAMDG